MNQCSVAGIDEGTRKKKIKRRNHRVMIGVSFSVCGINRGVGIYLSLAHSLGAMHSLAQCARWKTKHRKLASRFARRTHKRSRIDHNVCRAACFLVMLSDTSKCGQRTRLRQRKKRQISNRQPVQTLRSIPSDELESASCGRSPRVINNRESGGTNTPQRNPPWRHRRSQSGW